MWAELLCFGYSSEARQQASGSGAGLRVQACLHGLDLGLIIFLGGGKEIDGSERSVDPLECAKSVRFPGTVFTKFSENPMTPRKC